MYLTERGRSGTLCGGSRRRYSDEGIDVTFPSIDLRVTPVATTIIFPWERWVGCSCGRVNRWIGR